VVRGETLLPEAEPVVEPLFTSANAGEAGRSPAAATTAPPAMVQHITEALRSDRFTAFLD